MKQRGFTLIELLIVIAILGIITAVVISTIFNNPNIPNNGATNETTVTNETIFWQLASEPITSLNLTQLEFMVDYCLQYDTSCYWLARASLYQNQIITNELKEQP